MNLLVVIKTTNYAYNPTTRIAEALMREFSKLGISCHMFMPAKGTSAPENVPVKMHPFDDSGFETDADCEAYFAQVGQQKFALLKKLFYAVRHPFKTLKTLYNTRMKQDLAVYGFCSAYYEKRIRQVVKKEGIDAVLAFYMPEMILKIFSQITVPVPVFMYQLDPWTLHELFPQEEMPERLACETAAFAKAAGIFTTQPLLEMYQKMEAFQPFLQKMYSVEFPRLHIEELPKETPSQVDVPAFDPGYYNIVYTGTVSDNYRNPAFFLQVFDRFLAQHPKSRIYFMGINFSDVLKEYAATHTDSIILIPPQAPAVAAKLLQDGDALLNISNTLTYSMPSKIIEYVATGRPIINILKIPHCTSLRYLQTYPLGINLSEAEPVEEAVIRLQQFYTDTRGKRLTFDEVCTLYPESTPQFVAGKMAHVMKETLA